MPEQLLTRVAEFDRRPALISPTYTNIPQHLRAAEEELRSNSSNYALTVAAVFGREVVEDRKPFAFSSGLAFIPVTGVLLNRFPYAFSFATGYNAIRGMIDAALADPAVKGIVLDANSYGGMAQGCFELSDHIYQARQQKPILAVVDANAHSACYAIVSAASKIVAIRSASVGSIGVVAMHIDVSKALDKKGMKVTFVYAGEHKVDGNPYEPLDPGTKAEWQKTIDGLYQEFVATVARNRGLDAEKVRGTQARTYGTAEAIEIGLVDAVGQPAEAVSAFVDELSGSTLSISGEGVMTDKTKPGASQTQGSQADATEQQKIDQVSVESRKAERARVRGILTCEEAKGRENLAQHLALSTEMSVDEAKAILAAAPHQAEAPKGENAFARAMEESGNPQVGAEGSPEDDDTDVAARILRNYSAASGQKFN